MKKILLLLLTAILLSGAIFGCRDANANDSDDSSAKNVDTESQIPDLNGNWIESTHAEKDTYMTAVISEDTIEIFWTSDGGETKALYWSGTFTAPDSAGEYSWSSTNNTDKPSTALLASGDDTKDFKYSDSEITYEQSALGVTATVHLIREE